MQEILTLKHEIVKQIEEMFCFFESAQETTLDEIETEVLELVLEIGRRTVELIIKSLGTGYAGKEIKTPSGETAKYVEDRDRTVWTRMGPLRMERAYYHLGKGKGGYVPLDESLSLPEERYSYAVQEAMSLFAIEDSYQESAKKLSHLFPIKASGSTIRRISQKYGKEITEEEHENVKAIFSHKLPAPAPEIGSVKRGYVGVDGVRVPTVEGYKEMKVAATYDTPLAKGAVASNLHYQAMFAEPEVFGEHLWVMLKQRGIYDAIESVWDCDGAKWIWRQKQLHDPDGKEIVDLIHAGEYLQKIASAAYGQDTEQSQRCSKCMCLNLRLSGGEEILTALHQLRKLHPSEELKEATTYFRNNRKRMDYPAYEEQGYHITSSTVESACRHVVGDRLKRSGMRWTIEGAQYTTSLRLKWKNSKWEDFWKRYRHSMVA